MRIGIPKERKVLEGRVALVPEACADLVRQGHSLFIEKGAGLLSGYPDADYAKAGAMMLDAAADVYAQSQLIVKVKEPVEDELDWLNSEHILFSFLHLAANRELALKLKDIGLDAVAFETVDVNGRLPLLAPMSSVAGVVAAQVGTHLLHRPAGGRGILLGGVPGTERGNAVVLGAGVAGTACTEVLTALGANVTVFDKNSEKLAKIRQLGANVTTLYPYREAIRNAVVHADLVVGAVLIPGAKTPTLVNKATIEDMNEGSVVIDISVDQGGCIETTRPTSYADPTYLVSGVIHFGVTNMPGAVPRTASQALSAEILPFVSEIAAGQWQQSNSLAAGLNVSNGHITHPAVRAALA